MGLGEAGATVYITGRSVKADDDVGGSLEITRLAVENAGGYCIPIQIDHSDDAQVKELFERVKSEQNGQLDVLVNNVYGGVRALRSAFDQPFWESGLELWDACNQVGLRSHYVASIHAARMMVPRQQGLICNISSWGGLSQIFGVAYGSGKAGVDRMSADMAFDLASHNVAAISIWPGIVSTEHMTQLVEELSEENRQSNAIGERYNWETPLLTGRVIASLSAEPQIMKRTGRVQIVAELAKYYGLVDQDGQCPASLRSLRFILPNSIPALRKCLWLVPDLRVPWWVLLLSALKSPKI